MRLDDMPESGNVEDRRGDGGGFGGGGGMGGLPIGTGGLGIGGMVVLGLIGWALGIDPFAADQRRQHRRRRQPGRLRAALPAAAAAGHAPHRHAERRGRTVRRARARQHRGAVEGHLLQGRPDLSRAEARDVLGRRRARPAARRRARWGRSIARTTARSISTPRSSASSRRASAAAPARPAISRKAYVIAHEVGHHVQNLLGILPKVQQAQRASGDRAQSNHLQVQVELQADCFAGVWANHAEAQKQFLDPGDIDAALQTASAIGDDTLQRKSQGQVVPDSFTHGIGRAAQALVLDRVQGRHHQGLQHLRGGQAIIGPPCPASTTSAPSCRSRSRC